MTIFLLKGDLNRWLHQNEAEYTGDFFDGCLLDNFIVSCKNGIAALYEHYLNCWSSCYEVHFGRTEKEKREIYDEFYRYQELREVN